MGQETPPSSGRPTPANGSDTTEWPLPDPRDGRYLFEANPLPLLVYDLQTLQIVDVNTAACVVYGYGRDEFCALTIRDIRPAEDVQYVEESVRRTPSASRYSGVWRHLTKEQVLMYVEINSRELVYQGRPARLVCPVDVTQRVHAEAALRDREAELNHDVSAHKSVATRAQRLNEVLERRIHERTAELERSNDELAAAKAAAEKANRAKSDFLSSMSHELRTPLNAVIGFGQLLAATAGEAAGANQHARYVHHIVEAGQHLLMLINELLDLAQIESGKVSVQLQSVPMQPLLDECRRMMAPLAAAHSVRLIGPVDGQLHALADRGRLKQALINLLSNAIKYNRPGGAVGITCSPSRPLHLRIEVRDTGAGLRPHQLADLFQPFNRLGQEAGRTEGSGIGLVLTRRLVELMNGEIGASSAPDVGSVFWIELPEAAALPAPAIEGDAGLASVQAHGAATAQQPVLCVDDQPASQMLVEEILRHRPQLKLLKADNGWLGVELARAHRPAIIFMDNDMPGMSGHEAQRILRADARTAHIPIIALTASMMAGDVEDGVAAGFFRYLAKPVDVAELLEAVDEALRGSEPTSG